MLDRPFVVVVTHECRLRISLRHDDGGRAVSAANIGYACTAFEFRLDAGKRRNPVAHEIRCVARTEEALGAVKERDIMLMPSNAQSGLERLHHLRDDLELRDSDLESAGDERRAAFLGKREGLLLAQAEAFRCRIISDVAARSLGA